jgi:hypothetical protein
MEPAGFFPSRVFYPPHSRPKAGMKNRQLSGAGSVHVMVFLAPPGMVRPSAGLSRANLRPYTAALPWLPWPPCCCLRSSVLSAFGSSIGAPSSASAALRSSSPRSKSCSAGSGGMSSKEHAGNSGGIG